METGLCVADIMTRKPVTVPQNLSVRESARLMKNKGVGSLLVTENDELLGILTKSDVIREVVAEGLDAREVTVGDIMVSAVITVAPDKDIFDALVLMKDHEVRHLPVLDADALAGFLTIKDIIKINPALFELIRDNIELREEERKFQANPWEPAGR